ncbi:MAG: putative zinc-binding protein [Ignavibacteria bacterium]
MKKADDVLTLEITNTNKRCAVGEKVGSKNLDDRKIPVISCEGACIRGEIARLAANKLAKEEPFKRACHGELLTVPGSNMTEWIKKSEKVVLIDGCFLRCHGRILENLIGKENLIQFDALSYYKKYTDRFDIDSVPEEELKETAELVADRIFTALKDEKILHKEQQTLV